MDKQQTDCTSQGSIQGTTGINIIDDSNPTLPWFIERMTDDVWHFGLMLDSGVVLGISTIEKVTQTEAGELWLDCRMLTNDTCLAAGIKILTAPCPERSRVSVNASHVVWAFEIAST